MKYNIIFTIFYGKNKIKTWIFIDIAAQINNFSNLNLHKNMFPLSMYKYIERGGEGSIKSQIIRPWVRLLLQLILTMYNSGHGQRRGELYFTY